MDQSEDKNNIVKSTKTQEENRIPLSVWNQEIKPQGRISLKQQDLINMIAKLEEKISKMRNMTDKMRERIEYLESVTESKSKLLQQIHAISAGNQHETLIPQTPSSAHSVAEIINYTPQGSPTNTIQYTIPYTIHADGKTDEPLRILITDSSRLELPETNDVGANVDIMVQPSSQLEENVEKQSVSAAACTHKIIGLQVIPQEQIQMMNVDQNEPVKIEKDNSNSTDPEATMSSINSCSDFSTPVTIRHISAQVRRRNSALKTRNVLHSLESSTNDEQTTQIGVHGTTVPTKVLENIQWKSSNTATRILLRTIFGRRVLAVSSMTGKASPAFKDKPLKKKLDPLKLKDIITIVTQKCKVDESSVRKVVTTMCSDENKNLRLKAKMSSIKQETDKEN